MIAKVMLTNAAYTLSREFDYLIPPQLEEAADVGMRVIVPFGVRNGSEEGIITGFSEESKYNKIKSVKQFMDKKPVITKEQLSLLRWMQKHYLCSFSQAYKQVRPPRVSANIHKWLVLKEDGIQTAGKKLSDNQIKLIEELKKRDGQAEVEEIKELSGIKNISKTMYALSDMGIIEICEDIKNSVSAKYMRKVRVLTDGDDVYLMGDKLYAKRADVQANMLIYLYENGDDMSCAELIEATGGNYTSLNGLCEKKLVEIYKERIIREAYDEEKYKTTAEYTPTEEQKPVIDYLNKLTDNGTHEKILLRGVTGSGKTEVFLQAIKHCIDKGRQAVMLVPEISLTPQMVERFVSRFGNSVAVMHSGLSIGERYDQWTKIKNGQVKVVVGARSAIFAPFENIGIIILDEEHETSYKSDISPRYHAKEVAFKRGKAHGAPVLLASATPEVSTYYRALKGDYKLFEMNKRYNENDMPKARIVDMRSELFELHNNSPISIRLQEEIRLNLSRGEKTVLFLNRRGYNTFVSCRQCGEVIKCPNCSIAMTYHKNTDKLICHYCGEEMNNVALCPACGSKHIRFFGTGTQRIEDELKRLFPQARILRMDYDTTSKKGSHERILSKFKNGEGDILLGTQMVTKGLDIPEVTLVGVLAADTALNVDDFRANEKCFSLITQVCGRAGRGDTPGRAVIQTYQPQNRTICYAKEQSYTDFYENEIQYRRHMNFPPFSDIISILIMGEDEEKAATEAQNVGQYIKDATKGTTAIEKIIGPAPAPVSKIKGKYRYRILIKAVQASLLEKLLEDIYSAHEGGNLDNIMSIDINPNNML